MNKRISLGASIAIMLVVAAVTFSITRTHTLAYFNTKVSNLKERENVYEKYAELDRLVQASYNGTINESQLLDSVAKGYVEGIGDKYANYISAEEYARQTQATDDDVGVGLVVEEQPDGYLLITEVYPDSPAQLERIEAGDIIVKVDGTDLTPELEGKANLLNGANGTRVDLVVRRGSEEQTVELTRRNVIIPSVESRMLDESEIGYILIKEFTSGTSDQFSRELDRLMQAGARALVIDLRDNKGGGIRQTTRILDRLVPAGIIYTASYKDGSETRVTSDANELDLPMAVIVNGETAGTAELFAQVLKDYDKARIVGTTTAGNGAILETVNLSDGSAVELTVAFYTPPNGETFNDVGIKPDFDVTIEGDWTDLDADMATQLDPQLRKAIEAVETGLAGDSQDLSGQEEEGSGPETETETESSIDEEQPEDESKPEETEEESSEGDDPDGSSADESGSEAG